MITLASNCLVFKLASGEKIPFSPDMISVDMVGQAGELFDPEFVEHAAQAVFHYFRVDLGRETVTVGEFAETLEKVLRGFKLPEAPVREKVSACAIREADLAGLARESGQGCELFFFPKLRDELRQHLRETPKLVRFRGLRVCVKQLTGSRRWNPRCRQLQYQIVDFLRECLSAEAKPPSNVALLVE